METLETAESPSDGTVMPVLGQAQNPCTETLEGASGVSCTDFVFASEELARENGGLADISIRDEESNNVEVEDQVLDTEKFSECVGGISVGAREEVLGDGNNILDFGASETVSLVDEAVAKENQMNGGSMETVSVPYSSEKENDFVLVNKVSSTDSGTEEAEVAKVLMQEEMEEEQDASQMNLCDSGDKIDISNKGISLYVEFCGPLDGFVQSSELNCLADRGLFRSNFDQENESLLPDNGKEGSILEVEDCDIDENAEVENVVEGQAVANQGYRFNVGDLAWFKTKTQTWWPALICEPPEASSDSAKSEKKDHILVRHFGSGILCRCWPSQLKPFHEYFEQMARQSNSRSFLSAVEKAVGEIGRHAKLEMTCSCFLENSRISGTFKEGSKLSKEKACDDIQLSVIQFEPAELLARIKLFAQDVSVPGTIEFTVIQKRLSAFYRSKGHHHMAIHELKPTCNVKSDTQDGLTSEAISSNPTPKSKGESIIKDAEDCSMISSEMKMSSPIMSLNSTEKKVHSAENCDGGTDSKSEKGYESRERRKSKYLSFPYVDLSHGSSSLSNVEENEADRKTDDVKSIESNLTDKSCSKKSQKRCLKKPVVHLISDPDAINASSGEMLLKLRFTALDCLYPDESRNFDLVGGFFSRFRRFSFRDFTHEIVNEAAVLQEFNNEMDLPQTLTEVEGQNNRNIEKESKSSECRNTKSAVSAADMNRISETAPTERDPSIECKPKGRKKKEATIPLGTKPTDGVWENLTDAHGPVILNFQKMGPHSSESQSVPIKRKRKAHKIPGSPQIKVVAGLPDLSGREIGSLLQGCNVTNAVTPFPGKYKPKRKVGAASANCSDTNGIVDLPDVNGSIGKTNTAFKEVEVMDLYSLQDIPSLNKEGTKEAAKLHLNVELTGNPHDMMKGTELTGTINHCDKPERKRRKRKQKAQIQANVTSSIPDLNGNASEPLLQGNQLTEMKCISPEGKPRRKRRKKADAGLLDINLSYNETEISGEASGYALLLKFSPEDPVPSKEDLVSTFCTYGPLKESETQVLNDSGCAQVVFVSSSDARNAFRSLEKNSPFGPALVNYRLHILIAAAGASEPDGSLNLHQAWPVDKVKSPPRPRTSKKPKTREKPSRLKPLHGEGQEAPDLQYVRQNLQAMTSMLKNAGDNLSPEMRAKLELDINSLLQKVSTMVGSSSA